MTNQITVTVAGTSRTDIVKNLRAFADNLDGAPPKKSGAVVETDETEETETETEEADFAPPKKTGGKKAAAFEDEEPEAEETESAEFGEEEEEAPAPKKSAKAKAPTKEDVNEACKAHAKKNGFEVTKALLMKKFKTSSVSKLKPEQYPAVLAAVKA